MGINNADQPIIKRSEQIPSWVGFVIIVVFALVAFGGVFAYQYFFVKPQPVVQTQSQPNQIVGWKTYTNTEYGFEFQYPADWRKDNAGAISFSLLENGLYQPGLIVNVYENKNCYPIDRFIQEDSLKVDNQYTKISLNSKEKISSDVTHDVYKATWEQFSKITNDEDLLADYYFKKDGDCVIINLAPGVGSSETYSKIISTFKFTAPVNRTDWTKYTNNQLMAMANPDWSNQAMGFKGLEGNFLIIDQGTAPDPRGLIIYDLSVKKQVLSDRYSRPLDITSEDVSYWNPTNQKVTAQNCPDSVKWAQDGLGAGFEKQVSFSLVTLVKKDLGQTRCSPRQ